MGIEKGKSSFLIYFDQGGEEGGRGGEGGKQSSLFLFDSNRKHISLSKNSYLLSMHYLPIVVTAWKTNLIAAI